MEDSWCTWRVHDVLHSVTKLWIEEKGKRSAGWTWNLVWYLHSYFNHSFLMAIMYEGVAPAPQYIHGALFEVVVGVHFWKRTIVRWCLDEDYSKMVSEGLDIGEGEKRVNLFDITFILHQALVDWWLWSWGRLLNTVIEPWSHGVLVVCSSGLPSTGSWKQTY